MSPVGLARHGMALNPYRQQNRPTGQTRQAPLSRHPRTIHEIRFNLEKLAMGCLARMISVGELPQGLTGTDAKAARSLRGRLHRGLV